MMRACNVEEGGHGSGDPWEVFTQLVIQIVEGRTPGGEKGFHAGPHCSLANQTGINRHVCDPSSAMCARMESLLRQLRLMWGVGVGVTVEVLVAPECEHGAAFTTTLDTTPAPSSQLRLIEQWNFAIFDRSLPDTMQSGWSLVAAVRSFLHFSQLSAWLSVSGGARPPNVLYRLTVTSPVFCSKFEEECEEHTFPVANVGQETAIKVVVRSLPRSSQAPVVVCHESHQKEDSPRTFIPIPPTSCTLPSSSTSSLNSSSVDTLGAHHHQPPGASKSEWTSDNLTINHSSIKAEEDLRRSMMRARLGDATRASRSESPDTQLGESLLDPPNSLSRIPRRFQSPSRSGSPSMETPEHIICRVRQPGPTPGRPPDMASFCQPLVIPARQPLNAFAWTQTRYPTGQLQHSFHLPPHYHPHAAHHSVHSEIFRHHASAVPSEPLALTNHPPRLPPFSFRHPTLAPPPQIFFGSASPIIWPQPQQQPHPPPAHIPSREKCSGTFAHHPSFSVVPHCPAAASRVLIDNEPQPQQDPRFTDGEPQEERFPNQNHSKRTTRLVRDGSNFDAQLASTLVLSEMNLSANFHSSSPSPESHEGGSGSSFSVVRDQFVGVAGGVPASFPPLSTFSVARSIPPVCQVERGACRASTDPVSPTKGRESQGTKRKGAYTKESPRTKRESPPHVYYSKEGKELETLRMEATKKENNGSKRIGQEEMRDRKNDNEEEELEMEVDNRRKMTSSSGKRVMVNDQLWPSCSQPGKHLCSSVEDLADIAAKEQPDLMSNIKSLRKDRRGWSKMDSSSSSTSKVSFDLTPKETEEVLRLLRHNTPVPPLRISQHKGPPYCDQSSTITVNRLESCDEVQSSDCLRLLRKAEKNGRVKRSEAVVQMTKESPASSSKLGGMFSPGKLTNVRCHKLEGLKKGREEIPPCATTTSSTTTTTSTITTTAGTVTQADGNAYPTSSNQSCDTNFKKSSKYKCDRKLAVIQLDPSDSVQTDPGKDDDDGDDSDDGEVLDGLSQCEIENMKREDQQRSESRQTVNIGSCVEARTITQKTNYFTASSQPATGAKDILKQTSQALGKRPLTSVLTSLRGEASSEYSEESREKARRALSFEATDGGNEEGGCGVGAPPRLSLSHREGSPGQMEVTPSQEEVREDFVRSVSLLKHHLMRKPLLADAVMNGRCQEGEKKGTSKTGGWYSPHSHVPSDSSAVEECERGSIVNGHAKRPLFYNEGGSVSSNEEDKEVEDLCRAKGLPIPSTSEKVKFRRSLDSAATLVFHNKTGLPLTSSPAPLRKGTAFDFDSTLNSIAGIRNAFRTCDSEEEECDLIFKDDSPFAVCFGKSTLSASAPATVTCSNLLGSFEECVLNGRLEPVSTVHGFVAEIAASGVFCPRHTTKPVTVFFYTLCDNDQISSPYMGHINLGKKGYHIPSQGTVQVTLFNPHGTVVKMFVVVYDLSDMPPNSKTFLRQRTLNMPVTESDSHPDAHQWLRYLIHLRFASSKSGKIYLHTDIRMLILRKSDADAATLHKNSVPYELRSFTNGPTNPKFSPRK